MDEKVMTKKQLNSIKLIGKDVHRTFPSMKLFPQAFTSGENKLYNVLKAYSLHDSDIGYT